jgi:hypothetical protein
MLYVRKKIKATLKVMDTFGEPILFSYRGKTAYKTWIGGLLTMIVLGLMVIFSFEAVISLILRENMRVAFTEIYEQDPYQIRVAGKDGFYLAMGLQPDSLNNQSRKHFEIKLNQRTNRRHKNGTQEKLFTPIDLNVCGSENFPPNYDYVKFGYNTWLCPQLNQSFLLEGKYESDVYKFIQITVEKCVNTSTVIVLPPKKHSNTLRTKGST